MAIDVLLLTIEYNLILTFNLLISHVKTLVKYYDNILL